MDHILDQSHSMSVLNTIRTVTKQPLNVNTTMWLGSKMNVF